MFLAVKPIAKVKLYTAIGCRADEMGVGPRYAIPKLLDKAGMSTDII
jgi:acetyl-CoA acyltransferase